MTVNADGNFEFSFKRTPAVIEAFGEKFTLPVRNAELLEKLIAADMSIASASAVAKRAEAYRNGIVAFIGEDAAEKHFPMQEIKTLDLDEMQSFYEFCINAVKQKSEELINAKYSNENI